MAYRSDSPAPNPPVQPGERGTGRARIRVLVLAILSLLLLPRVMAVGVQAQDPAPVEFFRSQFIPVESIQLVGSTVVVTYQMKPVAGTQEFYDEALYILGSMAREYPQAGAIRVDAYVGEQVLFQYSSAPGLLLDYANGAIGDKEVLSAIGVQDLSRESSLFAGSSRLLAWGLGILLAGVAAVVLGGGWVVLRRRSSQVRPVPSSAPPATRPAPLPGAPATAAWASLTIAEPTGPPTFVPLKQPTLTLGRSASSDVVVANPFVSRRHAQIQREGGGAVLYDLDSTHGTFVNGQRVVGRKLLRAGDVIRLGSTEIVFGPPAMARQPGGGKAQLSVSRGHGRPAGLNLRPGLVVRIGRSHDNDLVVVGDPYASRSHAEVRCTAAGCEIATLSASNPLYVNGERVSRARLRPGDRIRLGNTELTYRE